ncbi:MAG: hypothetical protein ISP86_04435 [Shewanellaceae bacterium]|nr:hypothetical protein [Shewanellaceae bacterium]
MKITSNPKLHWRKFIELGYFVGYLIKAHSVHRHSSLIMWQRAFGLRIERVKKTTQQLRRFVTRLGYRRLHWLSLLIQWSQLKRKQRLLQQVKRNKQVDYKHFLDRASRLTKRRKVLRELHWYNQKVKWVRATMNLSLHWKRFYKKIEPDDLY